MAGQNGLDDSKNSKGFVLYHYDPSKPAAIVFVALFAISSLLHIYQIAKKRSWFMIPFIIGGLFETVGYMGRIASADDPTALNPFIVQTLLLLLAPALFAASVYMVLGRIILLTDGDKYALIRRTWLTKVFVIGDVLSFLAQALGGSILSQASKHPENIEKGENIILVGLFLQIFFFGLFIVVSVLFQIRGRAHFSTLHPSIQWRKYLYMLYGTSGLILIRSIFRVVEYLQGKDGYLLKHEIYLYVFDAAFMFGAMVAMNVIHPGDITGLLKAKAENVRMEHLQRPEGHESDYRMMA